MYFIFSLLIYLSYFNFIFLLCFNKNNYSSIKRLTLIFTWFKFAQIHYDDVKKKINRYDNSGTLVLLKSKNRKEKIKSRNTHFQTKWLRSYFKAEISSESFSTKTTKEVSEKVEKSHVLHPEVSHYLRRSTRHVIKIQLTPGVVISRPDPCTISVRIAVLTVKTLAILSFKPALFELRFKSWVPFYFCVSDFL